MSKENHNKKIDHNIIEVAKKVRSTYLQNSIITAQDAEELYNDVLRDGERLLKTKCNKAPNDNKGRSSWLYSYYKNVIHDIIKKRTRRHKLQEEKSDLYSGCCVSGEVRDRETHQALANRVLVAEEVHVALKYAPCHIRELCRSYMANSTWKEAGKQIGLNEKQSARVKLEIEFFFRKIEEEWGFFKN